MSGETHGVAQELQEFLNVMKSHSTKKTWKNDEVTQPSTALNALLIPS